MIKKQNQSVNEERFKSEHTTPTELLQGKTLKSTKKQHQVLTPFENKIEK
jgi:hypothetical protein